MKRWDRILLIGIEWMLIALVCLLAYHVALFWNDHHRLPDGSGELWNYMLGLPGGR